MENLYCNLKCIHCGAETALATSPTGHTWHAKSPALKQFIHDHGNCYLLDWGTPKGSPFTLSYGAKQEEGLPVRGELPLTDEQRAWLDEFKRQRQEA